MPKQLYEHAVERLKTYLKQRMTGDYAQEPLETLSPGLDDFVREAVGEYLARKRRNVHAGGFTLKDVTEGFKVGVTSANQGMT